MVKKIPTPPPGDDEPKYLAVYQPYPLNAHWELPADCLAFARWFACCVGEENLLKFLAFFYKPKARGIVLVEMDRSYASFERLLGEHAWNKFLQKPSDEEKPRVTQVFYSTYPSGREAQKDGWKRINVEDQWFRSWSPRNPIVHFPYPPTTWCQVPPEDKTNKPICRPLPASVLPAPPKPSLPVVGSAGWVAAQSNPNPSSPQVLRGAWGQRGGRGSSRAAAKAGPTVSIPRSQQPIIQNAKSPTSSVRSPTSSVKSPTSARSPTNAWNKNKSESLKSPVSGPPATSNPWGPPPPPSSTSNGTSVLTPKPPGLGPITPASSTTNTTTTDRSNPRSVDPAPDQLYHIQNNLRALSFTDASSSDDIDIYDIADEENVDPAMVYVSAWERPPLPSTIGIGGGNASGGSASGYDYDRDYDYDGGLGGGGGGNVSVSGYENGSGVTESLWGDDDGGSGGINKNATDKGLLCMTHGVICSKGICRDYGRQLEEKERAEKAKAKVNGDGNNGNGNGGNGNGNGNGGNAMKGRNGNNGKGWRKGGWKRGGGGGVNEERTADDGFSTVGRGGKTKKGTPSLVHKSVSSTSTNASTNASVGAGAGGDDHEERGRGGSGSGANDAGRGLVLGHSVEDEDEDDDAW